jgi:uncharacterized protein (TIGR04255 family)
LSQPLPTKNYPRAPITEAVIEIRLASEVNAKSQETAVRRLKKLYPRADRLQAFSVNVDTTGGQVGMEQRQQGFRLSSDEQTDIALVTPASVAVARLAPYPGWPVFAERAKLVWDVWRKSTPHLHIARIGMRTINRIDVPGDDRPFSLQTYLHFHPQVPDLSPSPMLGYLMQITLPTAFAKWSATITSTLVTPSPLLGHISLLLDIDVFRTEEIPGKGGDLWAVIGQSRAIKNDIFERCITDETRELIS